MFKRGYAAIVVSLMIVAGGGCATSEEWKTWQEHPAHFSSGAHMGFSLRNSEGGSLNVTRQDIALAGDEGWWGKAITIGQEQIIER